MNELSQRPGERVYRALKARLLNGDYLRGQRLNADDLATELESSRQPVFDAFKRLATEGFLTVRPHVGCTVATFDQADVRDYFELFAAVEGTAAALAAQRRTDDELRALRRLHAQIGGLASLQDPNERAQAYRITNREFHSRIHAMCGTPIVESFGAGMYDRADFYINGSAHGSPFSYSVPERHEGHDKVVAAIERQDAEAARTAASDHILGTVVLIEDAITRTGARSAKVA